MFAAMEEADRTRSPPNRPPMHKIAQPCPTNPVFHMHNSAQKPETYRRPEPKTGRNDLCPCGSGKKYKHCCLGKSSAAAA